MSTLECSATVSIQKRYLKSCDCTIKMDGSWCKTFWFQENPRRVPWKCRGLRIWSEEPFADSFYTKTSVWKLFGREFRKTVNRLQERESKYDDSSPKIWRRFQKSLFYLQWISRVRVAKLERKGQNQDTSLFQIGDTFIFLRFVPTWMRIWLSEWLCLNQFGCRGYTKISIWNTFWREYSKTVNRLQERIPKYEDSSPKTWRWKQRIVFYLQWISQARRAKMEKKGENQDISLFHNGDALLILRLLSILLSMQNIRKQEWKLCYHWQTPLIHYIMR